MLKNHRIQTIQDTINEDKGHIMEFWIRSTSYPSRCTELNIGLLALYDKGLLITF